MKRFLITSSDERTWNYKKPIIFLGEWCKKYSRKNTWQKLDHITSDPYGNNNKQKIQDSKLAIEIENNLILKIKNTLNDLHNVNYDERMWLIIIGPWLRRYSSLIINRVNVLKSCLDKYDIDETCFEYTSENLLIKNDSKTSANAFENEVWNQYLNYEILKLINNKSIKIKLIDNKKKIRKISNETFVSKKIIKNLIKFILKYTNYLSKYNRVALIKVYLNIWDYLRMNWNLFLFPYFRFYEEHINLNTVVDINLRNNLISKLINIKKNPTINEIATHLVFKIMPLCYIEGFGEMLDIKNKTNFPINPKYIITCVNCDTDEVFKFWAVDMINRGSQLIIYQHGNNYGTEKNKNNPSMDEKISDKFITWGWGGNNKKYSPSQIIKRFKFKSNRNFNKSKKIYLLENTLLHSYNTHDVYAEFNNYFSEQKNFVSNLRTDIKNNLIVKLHSAYLDIYHYEEDLRWKDFDSSLFIDKGKMNFKQIIKDSKIIVFSYDSSGFYESLAYNIPCLAFWQNKFEHVRDSAKPFYDILLQAELIFFSADKVADKVNNVYDDVLSWWYSESIQKARKEFCKKYANTNNNNLNLVIKNLIK